MQQQSLDDSTSVYNMVTEYFKLTVETHCSEKRFLSKYLNTYRHTVGQQVQLANRYFEYQSISNRNVQDSCFFMPDNTTSILQPMYQGVNSDF